MGLFDVQLEASVWLGEVWRARELGEQGEVEGLVTGPAQELKSSRCAQAAMALHALATIAESPWAAVVVDALAPRASRATRGSKATPSLVRCGASGEVEHST